MCVCVCVTGLRPAGTLGLAADMRHRGEIFRLSRDLKVGFHYVSAALGD